MGPKASRTNRAASRLAGAAASTFAKGDYVTYRAQGGEGGKVQARVLRLHRDGSATIQATFPYHDDGRLVPGFLGMKFRLPLSRLSGDRTDQATRSAGA